MQPPGALNDQSASRAGTERAPHGLQLHETRTEEPIMAQIKDSSIVASSFWMVLISLVLFFLPAINGLIGGAVGGYKAGSAGRGVTAAILPSVVVGLGLWAIFAIFDAPILGLFGGLAMGVWALISSIGLLIGAALGGAIAPPRGAQLERHLGSPHHRSG